MRYDAPMLPCICPRPSWSANAPGQHSAAARSGKLIKHNMIYPQATELSDHHRHEEGENEYTYPPYTEKQATELLRGLQEIAPYVVIDCRQLYCK